MKERTKRKREQKNAHIHAACKGILLFVICGKRDTLKDVSFAHGENHSARI